MRRRGYFASAVSTMWVSTNSRAKPATGLAEAIAKPLEAGDATLFARQIKYYFSADHRDDIEKSCAVAPWRRACGDWETMRRRATLKGSTRRSVSSHQSSRATHSTQRGRPCGSAP